MNKKGLLLDTCAVIWMFDGSHMLDATRKKIDTATADSALHISPISAWEIGMLVAKDRIALSMPVMTWIDKALSTPGIQTADMAPRLLAESSFLPGAAPGDPADRIIIATARYLGLDVVTRDAAILDYAKQGHVGALGC